MVQFVSKISNGGFFLPWEVALQVGWVAAGGVDLSGFAIKFTQFFETQME